MTDLVLGGVAANYAPPYLVDFTFSLHDKDGNPILNNPVDFLVTCVENGVAISPDESPYYFARASSKQLKCFLVMDYTASMASLSNGDTNGNGVSDAIDNMEAAVKDVFLPGAKLGRPGRRVRVPPRNRAGQGLRFHGRQALRVGQDLGDLGGPAFLGTLALLGCRVRRGRRVQLAEPGRRARQRHRAVGREQHVEHAFEGRRDRARAAARGPRLLRRVRQGTGLGGVAGAGLVDGRRLHPAGGFRGDRGQPGTRPARFQRALLPALGNARAVGARSRPASTWGSAERPASTRARRRTGPSPTRARN